MKFFLSQLVFIIALNFPLNSFAGQQKIQEKTKTPIPADDKKEKVKKSKKSEEKSEEKKSAADAEKEKKLKAKELANDKVKLERITETLKYGIQKDRMEAIKLMDKIHDSSLREKALSQLPGVITNEEDSEIKRTAISMAGKLKYRKAIPAIIKSLENSNDDVVIDASYALNKLKAMEAKPKLIALLKKRDLTQNSNITDSFIITLGELKAKELIKFAVENINNTKTSKMARERLVLFVGKVGSTAEKDFLLKIYNDDDEDLLIRAYAVKSIGTIKIISAKKDIKEKIKEIKSLPFKKRAKYYNLFINSVATLVKLGDNAAVPLLMDSLRSNSAGVRYKAVNLIKDFNDERTIDILKYKMKNDPSSKVRAAAKKILKDKGLLEEDKKKSKTKDKKESSREKIKSGKKK